MYYILSWSTKGWIVPLSVLFWSLISRAVEGSFISGENIDTSSDLMLAQMLQMEFDREFDAQLRREEKKFNGDSKGYYHESWFLC